MLKLSGWPRLTWGIGPKASRGGDDLLVVGSGRAACRRGSGSACAVAHHLPLPTRSTASRFSPPCLCGSGGQCPHAVGRPGVVGLLTPRQACPREGPSGATCVQRLDGSRDSAIHTTYRISLRSSSMREPRYPLPRVVLFLWPRQRRGARRAVGRSVFLGDSPRRVPAPGRGAGAGGSGEGGPPRRPYVTCSRSCFGATTMILPQVHLRKPCYDFSFL